MGDPLFLLVGVVIVVAVLAMGLVCLGSALVAGT